MAYLLIGDILTGDYIITARNDQGKVCLHTGRWIGGIGSGLASDRVVEERLDDLTINQFRLACDLKKERGQNYGTSLRETLTSRYAFPEQLIANVYDEK